MYFLKKSLLTVLLLTCLQAQLPAEETRGGSYIVKKFKYEGSLLYTHWTSNAWWTKIEPYPIYLGALPLKSEGHLQPIIDLGVTRVLSVVEDFEFEDGWLNKPVKIADWTARNIQVHHIPAVDFAPLTNAEIQEGVQYLADMIREGHTVYVHCKAGRGRSATIVIAYLMQYQGISLNEAIAFVKDQRPQINLNPEQRGAIVKYFGGEKIEDVANEEGYLKKAQQITEESFAKALADLLHYVIEGVDYNSSTHLPETVSNWIPGVKIQSTLERRNRYLRECQGDQELAIKTSMERNHGMKRSLKTMAAGFIPFVGAPTSYSITLWHQLREIALIAALHGHDLNDPQVRTEILGALVDGNTSKIPAQTVDIMAKFVIKKVLMQAGVANIPGMSIPSHLLFNYFTNNSAKVSTHAMKRFGGEFSLPISAESYK